MADDRIRIRIHGRVQGVGFRWHIAEHARRLRLAGWVRNNPDGSVELCAAGEKAALIALGAAAARGPGGASVSRVENLDASGDEELPSPFSITRG